MRADMKALVSMAVVFTAACADEPSSTSPLPEARASLAPAEAGSDQVGPNDYIVVLKDTEEDVSAASVRLASLAGATVKTTWGAALKGFLADVPPAALERLRRDPAVAYVEKDAMAYPDQDVFPSVVQPVPMNWGLDRIDQRFLPLSGTYTYLRTGGLPPPTIHVYVIDSGILAGHADFGGRVMGGVSFVPFTPSPTDCNGHGTHVASTIGGSVNGVAKGVILHPVRVFNCTGGAPFSRIITAVNWVQLNDIAPAVTNMSLGGSLHLATNAAVNALVASGNSVAVAAGNDNVNACGTSPASAANAITVGSTGQGAGLPPAFVDTRSSFSNWGPCLDLFAPGRNIRGAWWTSPVAIAFLSGTSMASPHAAGAAALLRDKFPLAGAIAIRNSLVANATLGVVGLPGAGSPNRLLYMGYIM
ncbi:MAG: S8 family serine peptidase [Gemmatimonadaceae bacterium]